MSFFYPVLITVTLLLAVIVLSIIVIAHREARRLTEHPHNKRQQRYAECPDLHPMQQLVEHRLDASRICLTTADGLSLAALYRPAQNGAMVILCHGYKMDCGEMIPMAAMLVRHGYGVLLPDLRSHGSSAGELISFGHHEWQDLDAVVDFIHTQQPAARIGLFGNSMGGALALYYAAREPRIAAVIAQSPYASIAHTINKSVSRFTNLPPFPFAPLINYFAERKLNFNTNEVAPLTHIGNISPRPVMLMMGGRDQVVPSEGIFALQQAAGEPNELWYEPELDHVEFHQQHPVEFERRVVAFYRHYLLDAANDRVADDETI
ncbi:MAG: alpha/beta fold hydrolase [Desulfuromonas sp.]|nr:alpha/beta fold hydrolase [Desulfuromonas sp.]